MGGSIKTLLITPIRGGIMLESKYTRRLSVKDLLALGVIFESQAARFYTQVAKTFHKDAAFKEKMMNFAQEDWANRKHFKEMIARLRENESIFVDEAEYQHLRQMRPENFVAMDMEHHQHMGPQAALKGILKFERGFMSFTKDLLSNPRGYNQSLSPTAEVMEMLSCEQKHLEKVEKFLHDHYPLA